MRNNKLPRVSIVIVNAKGTKYLQNCLQSVCKTDYENFEIIVVDCLTNNIDYYIKENFPHIKLINLNFDCDPAEEHNIGLKASIGRKYVAFLDDDVIVPLWLKPVIEVLEKHPEIVVVQPVIYSLDNPRNLQTAGFKINLLGDSYNLIYLYARLLQYPILVAQQQS